MPVKFIPGSRSRASKIIRLHNLNLAQNAAAAENKIICSCIKEQNTHKLNTSYNTNSQTANQRFSQQIVSGIGGRVVFIKVDDLFLTNYLGKVYGQPGGSGMPLRNTF